MGGQWHRESENGTVVVFIHGVLSSSETCWRNENGTYWPDLIVGEPNLSGTGVYLFSYETSIFSGSYNLGDVVDSLKEFMRLDGVFNCQTIVFVAHSMGGIVARKLLVERAIDFPPSAIAVGLFLVASPSIGATYANYLKPLARLVGHSQADALRFSQDNLWLMGLDREFINAKSAGTLALSGKELIEDEFIAVPGLIRRQVVEPFAAARYFGEAVKIGGSNHFSIAKPESRSALQHRLLVKFVSEALEAQLKRITIAPELEKRLEAQLVTCAMASLPFRLFHKLLVLLSMSSRFSEICFDTAGAGTAAKIREWCMEAIRQQLGDVRERGMAEAEQSITRDRHIFAARSIASLQGASVLDERHLLLALLDDGGSGTIRELARSLGDEKLDQIRSAATAGKPQQGNIAQSGVPALERGTRR
ncbi:esterase/lipase family protein [Rhizobium leguminosarum]|uniref:esterase/lipase family protein n=1 Tax=Rhizobium leguminosarum TaxID=384 RepID=UPI003F9C2423